MFLLTFVDNKPACVAVMTWLADEDEDDLGFGFERRRTPGPSLKGADVVDGRCSEGISSLGSKMAGDDMSVIANRI